VTIRVKAIEWGDRFLKWYQEERPVYPGVDGAVRYELKFYRTKEEVDAILARGDTIENPYTCDLYVQPFSQKPHYQTPEGKNVWQWDGNREAPTLTPSFALDSGMGWKAHLYFTAGKIVLAPDSTVTLEP
jgi:hypothetical protein